MNTFNSSHYNEGMGCHDDVIDFTYSWDFKKCGASFVETIQNQKPTNCNNIYFT